MMHKLRVVTVVRSVYLREGCRKPKVREQSLRSQAYFKPVRGGGFYRSRNSEV